MSRQQRSPDAPRSTSTRGVFNDLRPEYAWVPYGGGAHMCLGSRRAKNVSRQSQGIEPTCSTHPKPSEAAPRISLTCRWCLVTWQQPGGVHLEALKRSCHGRRSVFLSDGRGDRPHRDWPICDPGQSPRQLPSCGRRSRQQSIGFAFFPAYAFLLTAVAFWSQHQWHAPRIVWVSRGHARST